jgi:hypothetical protein
MARIPLHHAQQLCDEHEEDTHASAGSVNSESEEAQRQWEEDQDRLWAKAYEREMEEREDEEYRRDWDNYDPYAYDPFDTFYD